ncbi:MFS transporter [Sphaerisporangium rufum]|uniref:MFS transporter n=2 Tax=Sphaerisporangium rufum TaxID=1381558 RepID=A0A919R8Q9_9ACTN|nr:MFS transporter [Sphaerisporangium rufum]
MVALVAGVACVNTAMVAGSTAANLGAAEVGGPAWSGVPSAAGVAGTALGALGSGALMARFGRKRTLLGMYAAGVAGALIGFAGAVTGSLAVLLAGMVLLGLGNGGAQLSRYVAAELYPEGRRATALSAVLWGGTVGALGGPALITPAAAVAGSLGAPALSGPVAAAVLMMAAALACAITLPRRTGVVDAGPAPAAGAPRPGAGEVRAVMARPAVRTALVAMVAAQLAMVTVMTMTPIQLHQHGHGLGVVSWVLGAHLFGMFALAPISGRIADRWGARTAIAAGVAALVAATALATAMPDAHDTGLPVALFLLGYGWNLAFVGGSALLSRGLPAGTRTRVQGLVDALVWGGSGVAGLAAGPLFGGGGLPLVAVVSGVLALAPLPLLLGRSRERG